MNKYQELNQFSAKGLFYFGHTRIESELFGWYISQSNEPVQFRLWSEAEGAPKIFDAAMKFPYNVFFEGATEHAEPVLLMGISIKTITGFIHIEGDARIFMRGDFNYKVPPGKELSISSKITPTTLIYPDWMYLHSYDGTITKVGEDREREGIKWDIDQGTAQLIDLYEYVDGGDNEKHITMRIQLDSLILTIKPDVETELKAILLQLKESISDDILLLSFIGRKRISITEASVRLKDGNNNISSFARYKTWSGFYNLPSDQSQLRQLIKPNPLQEGGFNLLMQNYKKSPYKSIISRTIPSLLTSYEDGYLETHLNNVYASLESMVDGIGSMYSQEFLLGNNAFKRLSKKIGNLVWQEIEDGDIAKGIIKKIPELRRRSFIDRLLFLLQEQKVNTGLIWPPATDEPMEFHELIKRRNVLIHTGSVDQYNILEFDLNRVQKLVELWILKLLDCPEESINEYSLWRDAPIHKILHLPAL